MSSKQKNKKTAKKKTITLAHATITCLVKNTRKYFHFFGGVFFGVSVFVGFAKLNNITTQKHSNKNKKTPKINKTKISLRTTKTRIRVTTTKTMEETTWKKNNKKKIRTKKRRKKGRKKGRKEERRKDREEEKGKNE